MLRRISQVKPPRAHFYRTHSSYNIPPLKNLRVYNFQISPEQAERQMAKWGSLLQDADKWLASIASPYLSFVTDFVRPVRLTPVYFPAWVINGFIQADVLFEGSPKQNMSIAFRNTYIPGNDLPPLSVSSLWPQDLHESQPVPFEESDLKKGNMEVQCLPFNISPFKLLDLAASSDESTWKVSDRLKVLPNSIKPALLSASPILLPLYLAQYRTREREDGSSDLVTIFMLAHNSEGLIMSENSLEYQRRIPPALFENVFNISRAGIIEFDETSPRVGIESLSSRPVKEGGQDVIDWLEDKLSSAHDVSELAAQGFLESDDDPRIRDYTEEENKVFHQYISLTFEIAVTKRIIETMEQADVNSKTLILTLGAKKLPHLQSADSATATLKSKLEELKERREESIPEWWKQWKEKEKKSE